MFSRSNKKTIYPNPPLICSYEFINIHFVHLLYVWDFLPTAVPLGIIVVENNVNLEEVRTHINRLHEVSTLRVRDFVILDKKKSEL